MAKKIINEGGYKVKDKTARKTVVGKLSVASRGYAFLIPNNKAEDEEDVYISAEDLNGALNGDTVEVALTKSFNSDRSREGFVIEILEHANNTIVGTFSQGNSISFVIPDDARIKEHVLVDSTMANGAVTGSKVVVEITHWPKSGMKPATDVKKKGKKNIHADMMAGKILEVLGMKGEPGVDILSIMRQHGLSETFPEEVQKAADNTEKEINPEQHKDRKDRRHLRIVTVDGEDAKDLDDGVYAEKRPDGSFFLGVYIADVSWYVREGSALDNEAYERGTSVYLVDRVCPMLPKALSNGICSLNAGVDRLAMACEMIITPDGKVSSYEIFPTIIHVYRRLSYTIVNKILVDKDETFIEDHKDILPMLQILEELRNAMKNYRHSRGAIDFDIPEVKVKMDQNGKPVNLVKREGSLGESIIEQCMLAANETVAEHMCLKKLPFMYRIHQNPSDEKISRLNQLLAAFGLFLKKNSEGTIEPMQLQNVLEKVEGRPEERIVSTVSLRSMQQARYSDQCLGHFGLAATYYTHFTSPIRRYPDLIVHRLLRETFATGTMPEKRQAYLMETLPEVAEQASNRERIAVEAERETTDLKKTEYMAQFIGDDFEGVISSVTSFGFFVELDNGVEGLVHISSLADDYYDYVEEKYALVGQRFQKVYKLGNQVEVVLTDANIEEKKLDFVVKDNSYGRKEGNNRHSYMSHWHGYESDEFGADDEAENEDFRFGYFANAKKKKNKKKARKEDTPYSVENKKKRKVEPLNDEELIAEVTGTNFGKSKSLLEKAGKKKETGFEKFIKTVKGFKKSSKKDGGKKKGKAKTKVKNSGRKHHGKDNRHSTKK